MSDIITESIGEPSVSVSQQTKSYRIMVFSWNTGSIGLCETMDAETAAYNRTSYSTMIPGITTWKYACDIPDFYPKFSKFITDNAPDLVVIGFQEDRFPGSYFHSHLLPEEMPKIGYDLVKRTKLMGVGVTSYKGVLKGDLFERGLRLSIYAKSDLAPIIEREEIEMRSAMGNDGQSEYLCSSTVLRGKGAVSSYLMLPGFGRLAFICCHLPFNAQSLITERIYKNKMLRQNEINQSNVCFNNIIENLVLLKGPVPTHVIYFGDFNYRLSDPRSATEVANEIYNHCNDIPFMQNLYSEHDELKEQMRRKNIYEFQEGIGNRGPLFVPTCKMIKGRISDEVFDEAPTEELPMDIDEMVYYGSLKSNFESQLQNQKSNIIGISQLDPKSRLGPLLGSKSSEMISTHSCNETLRLGSKSSQMISTHSWKTGSHDQRVPSWCDRILYNNFGTDGHNLTCVYYDRFDVGTVMAKSDHAGVIGVFDLI